MKDITPINDKAQPHGYWKLYYDNGNGNLKYKGNWINGKEDGCWEYYYSNGNLNYTGKYINGKPIGYWEYYQKSRKVDLKLFYI